MNKPTKDVSQRLLGLLSMDEPEPPEMLDLEFPPDDFHDEMVEFMDAWLPDGQFIQTPPAWYASLQGLLSQSNPNLPMKTRIFHLAAEPESEQLCACRWLSYQYYKYFIVIDSYLDLHEWSDIPPDDVARARRGRTLAFIRHLDLSEVTYQDLVADPYIDIIIPRPKLPVNWQSQVLQLQHHPLPNNTPHSVQLTDVTQLQLQIASLAAPQQDMLRPLLEPKPLLPATEAVYLRVQQWSTQLGEGSHLRHVLDTVQEQTKLRALGGKALGFRPLLLTGEPGNAKSWLASQIAAVLGLPKYKIDFAGNGDRMLLVGSSRNWHNAAPGRIAQFLAESPVANPLIVIEEVDKALAGQDHGLQDLLLMLLEPENSKEFQDNFILPSLDLSHASFILTANDPSCLSSPLLSRLQQIELRRPNQAMMLQLLQEMYQRILKEMGVQAYFTPELPTGLAIQLVSRSISIRALRFNVQTAIEAAVKEPELSELLAHQHSLMPKLPPLNNTHVPKPPLGFLP
ncbi:AAA family ATPase [Chitinibacter fontanus]|uniref:AAA family ATPase n=1 Tax=Chitinibacter fontanus TaxID=1737446 RepID=A0A7D5ZEX0_9NEIS|nr:AAA family ATPase [Chitinibacter fontanus]QLI81208.1 AAA family ATPase [Chitinibacter fontanus]